MFSFWVVFFNSWEFKGKRQLVAPFLRSRQHIGYTVRLDFASTKFLIGVNDQTLHLQSLKQLSRTCFHHVINKINKQLMHFCCTFLCDQVKPMRAFDQGCPLALCFGEAEQILHGWWKGSYTATELNMDCRIQLGGKARVGNGLFQMQTSIAMLHNGKPNCDKGWMTRLAQQEPVLQVVIEGVLLWNLLTWHIAAICLVTHRLRLGEFPFVVVQMLVMVSLFVVGSS